MIREPVKNYFVVFDGLPFSTCHLVLSAHLQTSCFNELLDLTTSNQEDGTVGLKQWPGGQQEWDKVMVNMLRRAL